MGEEEGGRWRETGRGKDVTFRPSSGSSGREVHSVGPGVLLLFYVIFLIGGEPILPFLPPDESPCPCELEICLSMG